MTALCCNDEHTVSTTRTIHGGGRGVLKDREALDYVWVEVVEVVLRNLHTIHNDKRRLGTTNGGNTTDVEVRTVGTRLTATLCGDDTRQTAGE